MPRRRTCARPSKAAVGQTTSITHPSCADRARPGDRRPCAPALAPSFPLRAVPRQPGRRARRVRPRSPLRRCCRATEVTKPLRAARQLCGSSTGTPQDFGHTREQCEIPWPRTACLSLRSLNGQTDAWEERWRIHRFLKTTAAAAWTGAWDFIRAAMLPRGRRLGVHHGRGVGHSRSSTTRYITPTLHGTRLGCLPRHAGCGPPKGRHGEAENDLRPQPRVPYRKERPVDCDPLGPPSPRLVPAPLDVLAAGRPAPASPSGWEDASNRREFDAERASPPCPSAASRSSSNHAAAHRT